MMQNINVLIVEDDRDIIEDLPLLLSTYQVEAEAVAASDAERRFREGSFNFVLLDLKMPAPPDMTDEETDSGRLTGIVLCRRLREINPRVPILVVTSVEDPRGHELVRQAGANRILVKPTYPDDIVQQMNQLMRRS